jgi:hypothetical protein
MINDISLTENFISPPFGVSCGCNCSFEALYPDYDPLPSRVDASLNGFDAYSEVMGCRRPEGRGRPYPYPARNEYHWMVYR